MTWKSKTELTLENKRLKKKNLKLTLEKLVLKEESKKLIKRFKKILELNGD